MKKIKGFTLIELIVVISIIGFLSSIVLVSLQGVREKARFAAAMKFYKHTQSVLFDKGVYVFNFDNSTLVSSGLLSTTASSSSQSLSYVQDTTLFKRGNNLQVSNSNMYIENSDITKIAYGYDFTIGTWFYPTLSSYNPSVNIFNIGVNQSYQANNIYIDTGTNKVCVKAYNQTGKCSNMKVEQYKWYYMVAVFKNIGNGTAEVTLYVDGKAFKTSFTGIDFSQTTYDMLEIGSDTNSSGFYDEAILADTTF